MSGGSRGGNSGGQPPQVGGTGGSGGEIQKPTTPTTPVESEFTEESWLTVPSIKDGEFNRWFDEIPQDKFMDLWNNKDTREQIEARIRKPGGLHEILPCKYMPKFKNWGITMKQIKEWRFPTSTTFKNPPGGSHNGMNKNIFHNEVFKAIESSSTFEEFLDKLNDIFDKWFDNGRDFLPSDLQRSKK